MKPLRVLSIFGTRPEAVKMAPVVQALAAAPGVESLVCVTAQHRQMLDQVLDLFGIHPDVDLNLMKPNQSLAELTAAIFTHLDPVLEQVQPDWVLVQGDTTTVMAAALAAFYRHIAVGHVEAGLRTGDRWQPFPEEINRRVAAVTADLHFAPTTDSRDNLLREGVDADTVFVTGNPAIDALQQVAAMPPHAETRALLDRLGINAGGKRLALVTAHRRENLGQPLEDICSALAELAGAYTGDLHLIWPVHLNPAVQNVAQRRLGALPNVTLLPAADYHPMVTLLSAASIVLTDSGGIQEESTALKIPTLVMREVTERPEGVKAGVLRLVGTDPGAIVPAARQLLDDPAARRAMQQAANPFGDGHAAERIAALLVEHGPRHE